MVWSLLGLVVSPPVVPNLPRLRLLGPSCCVLIVVPCFASLSALPFPGISQCPGIHWMDVSTSFYRLCSFLGVVS